MGCLLLPAEDRKPWSQWECLMHINCLVLLEATLANKILQSPRMQYPFFWELRNNTTTVAYINNLGGKISRNWWYSQVSLDVVNIHITAVYLPRLLNIIADKEFCSPHQLCYLPKCESYNFFVFLVLHDLRMSAVASSERFWPQDLSLESAIWLAEEEEASDRCWLTY